MTKRHIGSGRLSEEELRAIYDQRYVDHYDPHAVPRMRRLLPFFELSGHGITFFVTTRSSQSTPVALEQKSKRNAESSRRNFATSRACSLSIKSDDCWDGLAFGTMSIFAPNIADSICDFICSSDSIMSEHRPD